MKSKPKTFIINSRQISAQTDDSGTHASLALFPGSHAWAWE